MESLINLTQIKSDIYDLPGMTKVLDIKFGLKNLDTAKVKDSGSNLIIFYLDKSGSMSGNPIKLAKEAMLNIMEELSSTHEYIVIPFESSCSCLDFRGKYETSKTLINPIQGGGGTAFIPTFRETEKIIKQLTNKNTQLSLIYLTDGCAENREVVMKELNLLIPTVTNATSSCQVHCLGFGSSHDAALLGDMAKILPDGTFQYIAQSDELNSKMQNLIPLLQTTKIRINLFQKANNFAAQLSAQPYVPDESEENWDKSFDLKKVRISIPSEIPISSEFEIEIQINESKKMVSFKPQDKSDQLSGELKIELLSNFVTQKLIESTNKITKGNLSAQEMQAVKEQFERATGQLEELQESARKIKSRIRRKEILSRFQEVHASIASFYEFHRKNLAKTVTNEDIAKMYDIAFRGNIKRGLQKKLDQRSEANTGKFEHFFKMISANSEKVKNKSESLRSQYKELIERVGKCFYTTSDTIDLLEEEDCMAICLNITRSEAAIADSSKISIRDVFYSKIGVAAFQDAYESALGVKMAEDVNGGFKHQSGAVMKGSAGEEINAIMPLYLFNEHWDIAQYWMKMSLGLTVTLDPLGYAFDQLVTVPFLVLDKVLKMNRANPSPINQDLLALVQETCVNIYKDVSKEGNAVKFCDTVKEKFENYMNNLSSHTVDITNSNPLFIMHIYVAQLCGDIPLLNQEQMNYLKESLFEEECRRSCPIQNFQLDSQSYLSLIGESYDEWIQKHASAYEKKKMSSASGGLEKMLKDKYRAHSGVETQIKEETKLEESKQEEQIIESEELSNSDPDKWTPKLQNPTKLALEMIEKVKLHRKKYIKSSLENLCMLCDKGVDYKDKLSLKTTEKKLVFALQIALQTKNADRREAVVSGKYVDPYNQEKCENYLKENFVNFVKTTKKSLMSGIDQKLEANYSAQLGSIFANTSDIEVAFGAIMGAKIGTNVSWFYNSILTNNAPLFKEKIVLLLGLHPTFQVYTDVHKNNISYWKPRKNRCFRLFKKYYHSLTKEEWTDLFTKVGSESSLKSMPNWIKFEIKE